MGRDDVSDTAGSLVPNSVPGMGTGLNEREGGKDKEPAAITKCYIKKSCSGEGRSGYLTKWINAFFLGCLKMQILIWYRILL